MVKPSVRDDTSVVRGALLCQRVFSKIVSLLPVLVLVVSAGGGRAFNVPGSKLGPMVKGGIGTTAALSAATSKMITSLSKIPQGKFAGSAILSAGTFLFSADQVEADNDGIKCKSTNYPGKECEEVTIQGCGQKISNNDCCQGYFACGYTCNSDIGCCSCNDSNACDRAPNAVFYDNVCNGKYSCTGSQGIRVYSNSCNNVNSCQYSPYLTVGANSCNGSGSCSYCCGIQNTSDDAVKCNTVGSGNITIPNNECNDPIVLCNTVGNPIPFCPWCPNCQYANGTSCYNSLLTGQATLSDAGITVQRALQTKKSKQKDKKSKETPMNCGSAKNEIVSYFQGQSIAKLRSKYTIGELAKSSDKGGGRKRSRDCNVELSWLFEHLEGYQLVQACAGLENQKTKLQEYLGKGWTIKNLKCIPVDKNQIH